MKKHLYWVCLVLVVLPSLAAADFSYAYLTGNNWRMPVTNYGQFGNDPASGTAGGEWPRGSGHLYIFGAGFWIGAIPGDTYVAIGYNPNSGKSEYAPGDSLGGRSDSLVRVYMYPAPWPPPLFRFPGAPQTTRSDADVWADFDDFDTTYHEGRSPRPRGSLGLQVNWNVYASRREEIQDVLYFRYEFQNQHSDSLKHAYAGVAMDYDIGSAANDYFAGYYHRRLPRISGDSVYFDHLACAYSGHESGWDTTGSLALVMIETPSDRGASAMKVLTLQAGDPIGDGHQYQALAGYDWWLTPPPYDPIDSLDNAPADKRILLSTGPFDLAPGQTESLVVLLVAANDSNPRRDPRRLVEAAWVAESLYFAGPLVTVNEGTDPVAPSPTRATIVRGVIQVDSRQNTAHRGGAGLLDISGRKVLDLHPGRNDVSRLAPGVYFVRPGGDGIPTIRRIVILK